jgi:uncharacterized Rossmann fold enzyme
MIVNWKRSCYNSEIVHIHGDNDRTIPIKNVKADYVIKNGSHMMVLTQYGNVNKVLFETMHMTK